MILQVQLLDSINVVKSEGVNSKLLITIIDFTSDFSEEMFWQVLNLERSSSCFLLQNFVVEVIHLILSV